VLKAELFDLEKVKRIVKVLGMVNSDPAFTQRPASSAGTRPAGRRVRRRGKRARSAGMAALPNGIPVEVEVIVEIGPIK
jgi:hypothetical protein